MVAAAADAPQFLAFRTGLSPGSAASTARPQINGSIRTYASIVAERLILQAGLPRPRSWRRPRADLQAVEIAAGGNPEMARHLPGGRQLAVGPADPQGYSVFYLADYEDRRGYTPVYSEVRDYRKGGKAAPRLVDYLNWDGDPGDGDPHPGLRRATRAGTRRSPPRRQAGRRSGKRESAELRC